MLSRSVTHVQMAYQSSKIPTTPKTQLQESKIRKSPCLQSLSKVHSINSSSFNEKHELHKQIQKKQLILLTEHSIISMLLNNEKQLKEQKNPDIIIPKPIYISQDIRQSKRKIIFKAPTQELQRNMIMQQSKREPFYIFSEVPMEDYFAAVDFNEFVILNQKRLFYCEQLNNHQKIFQQLQKVQKQKLTFIVQLSYNINQIQQLIQYFSNNQLNEDIVQKQDITIVKKSTEIRDIAPFQKQINQNELQLCQIVKKEVVIIGTKQIQQQVKHLLVSIQNNNKLPKQLSNSNILGNTQSNEQSKKNQKFKKSSSFAQSKTLSMLDTYFPQQHIQKSKFYVMQPVKQIINPEPIHMDKNNNPTQLYQLQNINKAINSNSDAVSYSLHNYNATNFWKQKQETCQHFRQIVEYQLNRSQRPFLQEVSMNIFISDLTVIGTFEKRSRNISIQETQSTQMQKADLQQIQLQHEIDDSIRLLQQSLVKNDINFEVLPRKDDQQNIYKLVKYQTWYDDIVNSTANNMLDLHVNQLTVQEDNYSVAEYQDISYKYKESINQDDIISESMKRAELLSDLIDQQEFYKNLRINYIKNIQKTETQYLQQLTKIQNHQIVIQLYNYYQQYVCYKYNMYITDIQFMAKTLQAIINFCLSKSVDRYNKIVEQFNELQNIGTSRAITDSYQLKEILEHEENFQNNIQLVQTVEDANQWKQWYEKQIEEWEEIIQK